jgi:antitoxin ParD1/3/4
MRKSTSILIEEDFDEFIDKQVADGRYDSASDVVEAGLRLLRDKDESLAELEAALIEGEESGEAGPFDFDAFLERKRAQRGGTA